MRVYVCVCMRVCVCACARAYVCVCVCVCTCVCACICVCMCVLERVSPTWHPSAPSSAWPSPPPPPPPHRLCLPAVIVCRRVVVVVVLVVVVVVVVVVCYESSRKELNYFGRIYENVMLQPMNHIISKASILWITVYFAFTFDEALILLALEWFVDGNYLNSIISTHIRT